MLAGRHCEDGGGRVPVIGRRDHECVDGLVVERAAEIGDGLHLLALRLAHGSGCFGQHRSVHVAHRGDRGVGRLGECLC